MSNLCLLLREGKELEKNTLCGSDMQGWVITDGEEGVLIKTLQYLSPQPNHKTIENQLENFELSGTLEIIIATIKPKDSSSPD